MRIKFLSVIVSFLFVSFAMSSCLGDDDPIEYSPNALVQAFELDNILGVNYAFTIDQLSGRIYNQDSLPVGSDTIIDRILIKTLSTAGYVVAVDAAGKDSLFNIEDSVNLVNTMEILPDGTSGKPFKFRVYAPDLEHKKEYSLSVRVHQQQPDSLNWGDGPIAQPFAPAITGKQKAIIFDNNILVYSPEATAVYSTALSDGKHWAESPISGLPSTDLTSIVTFKEMLYATVNGYSKVYSSSDGKSWTDAPAFGEDVVTLIAPISNILTGIKTLKETNEKNETEDVERFFTTDGSEWKVEGIVPQNFPSNNISATTFNNAIGVPNIMVVGNIVEPTENDTATIAWGYMEGQEWAALSTESSYTCPMLQDPSIMYYGDAFYIFGKDFKTFYKSVNGIVWNAVESMFMFPEQAASESSATGGFRGWESDYSMVVDKNNFIWIMRSQPNEVWRGRLNRLGFDRQ